jgi:NADH-quinone oxidoreductase subunit G
MLSAGLRACVLFGGVEPEADFSPDAAFAPSDFLVAITSHLSDNIAKIAQVVLPIGTFAETSGTYVNLEGRWQSWAGAIKPLGESRPGWKVLRVLGNLFGLSGFEYDSSEQIRETLRAVCTTSIDTPFAAGDGLNVVSASSGVGEGGWFNVPIYRSDALVRRSTALARTGGGQTAAAVT